MGKIAELVNASRKLKTAAELRAVVGKPVDPCQSCGSAILSVLHTGEVVCPDCCTEDGSATAREAFRIVLLIDKHGAVHAEDLAEHLKYIEWCKEVDSRVVIVTDSKGMLWRVTTAPGERIPRVIEDWLIEEPAAA